MFNRLKIFMLIFCTFASCESCAEDKTINPAKNIANCTARTNELLKYVVSYVLPFIDRSNKTPPPMSKRIGEGVLESLKKDVLFFVECDANIYMVNTDEVIVKHRFNDISGELNSLIGILEELNKGNFPDPKMEEFFLKYANMYYTQLIQALAPKDLKGL